MLKTRIEGKEVRIGFYHSQEPGWFVKGKPVRGYTVCTVKVEGEEDLSGEALCSAQDVFNKEVGRKISLSRAIQGFPRETRKQIWEAYFGRFLEFGTTYL